MKLRKEINLLSADSRLIEVILFLENEPVSLDRLEKLTEFDKDKIKTIIKEIENFYIDGNHGIQLVESNESYTFLPTEDLHEKLRTCYGKKVDRRLSKAALETLAIVAYSQPITRREIENIRGVSSDSIVRLLRDRDYIYVVGRKETVGQPSLYGTTKKFLYEFNLPSIGALPKLSDIDKERFESIGDYIDEL